MTLWLWSIALGLKWQNRTTLRPTGQSEGQWVSRTWGSHHHLTQVKLLRTPWGDEFCTQDSFIFYSILLIGFLSSFHFFIKYRYTTPLELIFLLLICGCFITWCSCIRIHLSIYFLNYIPVYFSRCLELLEVWTLIYRVEVGGGCYLMQHDLKCHTVCLYLEISTFLASHRTRHSLRPYVSYLT